MKKNKSLRSLANNVEMGHPSWGEGTKKVTRDHFNKCFAKDDKFFEVGKKKSDAIEPGTDKVSPPKSNQ